MQKVAVIGSCITRDIWHFEERPLPSQFLFYARTSLPSMFSQPVTLSAEININLRSRWQNRMLEADLSKVALEELKDFRPDVLIFDFIDERFDLVEISGSIVTFSKELDDAGLIDIKQTRYIKRISEEATSLWMDALAKLAIYLNQPEFSSTSVILHVAQWADAYRTNGEVRSLPEVTTIFRDIKGSIKEHNCILLKYQTKFLENIPGAKCLTVDRRFQLADELHKWGKSPFHYVPEYYADCVKRLRFLGLEI